MTNHGSPLYMVHLHGEGCRLKVRTSRLSRARARTFGFYTTRFVYANSPNEASERAKKLVRDELDRFILNAPDEPVTVSAEEVYVDPDVLPDGGPPGSGFTWY